MQQYHRTAGLRERRTDSERVVCCVKLLHGRGEFVRRSESGDGQCHRDVALGRVRIRADDVCFLNEVFDDGEIGITLTNYKLQLLRR